MPTSTTPKHPLVTPVKGHEFLRRPLLWVDLPAEEIRQMLAADHEVEVSRELVSSYASRLRAQPPAGDQFPYGTQDLRQTGRTSSDGACKVLVICHSWT